MRKRLTRVYSRHGAALRRHGRRLFHVLWYGVAVAGAVFAVAFVLARFLLPLVIDRKADLETLLSRESGYHIRIEQLEDHWDGLYPGLRMRGVSVRAQDSERAAVQLDELRVSLQLLPLFWGRLYIHSGVLVRPTLALERLSDGGFHIQGISAVEQTDPAQTEAFMDWLFKQSSLAIEDGQLQWLDWREPGRVLKLSNVNLQLRNRGDSHRLGMSAQFPPDMCGDCSLVVDVDGNPLLGTPFDGDVYVRARDVNVERLPLVVREHLPPLLLGVFSAELWSEWSESMPVRVQGELAVANLRLPLRGVRTPISVKQAAASLRADVKKDRLRVALRHLTLALHGTPWQAGTLEFVRDGDNTSLRLDRIELADLTAFAATLQPATSSDELPYRDVAALWQALNPTGIVKGLRVRIEGELDNPKEYTLFADVEGLAARPYKSLPGLSGVNGALRFTHDEGEMKIDVRNGSLALPQVFRAPLPVTRASADVRWQRASDQWVVTSESILFNNEDGQASGRMLLRLPDDPTDSPFLSLNVDFRDGNGAHAARYYPVHHLSPGLLKWMEYSFAGGTVTRGSVVLEGETRHFPFNGDEGKFQIRATVRDGIYRYLTGWDPVTGVAANVSVSGDKFVVTGTGRIGTLKATDILVRNDDNIVHVGTNVSGPVAESLRVLRAVQDDPENVAWKTWIPNALDADGNGTLSLDLAVPLHEQQTRLRGEYRFLNSTLRLTDTPLEAGAVNGALHFTEDGVREGRVRARFLGEETVLVIASPNAKETIAALRGEATATALAPMLGPKFAPFVVGTVPWEAQLRLAEARTEVSGEAQLSALKVSLPAPFNWPNGVGADKLVVRTETATRNEFTVAIEAGGLLQGRLRLQRRDGWRLDGGRVVFNEVPTRLRDNVTAPTTRGLHVLLSLQALDVDRWRSLLGDDTKTEGTTWLRRVSADIQALSFLGRDFGNVNMELIREKNGWVGGMSGAAMEGRMQVESTSAATRFDLNFTRLRMPESKPGQEVANPDPRKLPALNLKVLSFQWKDKNLGELDFAATPVAQGWKIDRLLLTQPDARMEASGLWRIEYGQPATAISARVISDDVGAMLAALGMPPQIDDSEVDINVRLAWAGAPADINVASLNGIVELTAKNGRFLKVDQGAARLFGLLDFSAIGRYLTLDFTPLFGKGFAFDRVEGKVTLEQGNAYTDNFSIKGPSARLVFSGRVGLAAEDFGLTMDVYPSLSDSLTLGSFLAGGPQVALWALIINKLFKKQIEEGTRVTYLIRGPWSKPEINRRLIERPASTSDVTN